MHAEPIDALIERLGADAARGLSDQEARARLARDGHNELPPQPRPSAWRRFGAQFTSPIVLVLLAAAVIALIDGASRANEPWWVRFGDATAILLIVALNAGLGFYQERRAEAALDALEKMQTPSARVRRGDQVEVIAAGDVVVGDLLELEAGDAVPADARLLQTVHLAAEESALTGESRPAGKDARAAVGADAPLGDRATMLFIGTTVVRGKGRALVVATGARTELGKIDALIRGAGDRRTPLEERLDHFGKRVLWACLGLAGLLFAVGLVKGDRRWHQLLLEAVSLAVAAIPEGLPAITTITLALGMQRMAKRGALIRRLAAVETLGAATVICTDKTGTLTQNEMTVREVYAGAVSYQVSGTGYAPDGDLTDPSGALVPVPNDALRKLLATVALCNNATLSQREDGKWQVSGDPTEAALLTLAAKGGVPKESVSSKNQVIHELPFDSDRKRMTIVTLDERGREVVHTKGSADVLLPLCASYETERGTIALDTAARQTILAEAERMSGLSYRVLAVARRDLAPIAGPLEASGAPAAPSQHVHAPAELEERLNFVGLVGMIDPPREGVKEAIRACADAHVRAVMITGDHKLTAVAIARELGLWSEDALALTGAELDALSESEVLERIDRVRVFARVTAEQKLRIVRAMKAKGHIVAMTGDGVNDAPALREAHIGVAMGRDGTDVARQAADMVLADDNFATIVEAVREGRAIYRNIQKAIFFLLSSNAGLLVTVFAAALLPGFPPLTPLMILWINLVTNGLPALALGMDPPDVSQMLEPPRRRTAGLMGLREYLGILAVGILMGGASLACYVFPWGPASGGVRHFAGRAVAFSLLALSPLFHAANCRSPVTSVFAMRPLVSRPLLAAVVLSAGIHLVAVVFPNLQPLFRTFPMSLRQWGLLLALSAAIIPAVEVLKLLQRATGLGTPAARRG